MDSVPYRHSPTLDLLTVANKHTFGLTGLNFPPRFTFGTEMLALHPNTRSKERSGILRNMYASGVYRS
jgi:hypothetical protein